MISFSIVLYKNSISEVIDYINKLDDNGKKIELLLVDNSPTPLFDQENIQELTKRIPIKYIHSNLNLGFGNGHNLSFSNISSKSSIFICSNLDVNFSINQVFDSIHQLNKMNIWAISPKFTGKGSRIPRYYPFFGSVTLRLIGRVFGSDYFRNLIERNNLYQNEKKFIPMASGAFLIITKEAFSQIKGFDKNMWMYIEDWDLSRKIWKNGGRILYDPELQVDHQYSTANSKSWKMILSFLKNLIIFKLRYQCPLDRQKKIIYHICENTKIEQ